MVYRGKPSAGCENCRRAKKRCGLERPACERCIKLKKICSGYRDTSSLLIHDETSAVKLRAEKKHAQAQGSVLAKSVTPSESPPGLTDSDASPPEDIVTELGALGDDPIVLFQDHLLEDDFVFDAFDDQSPSLITVPLKPKPEDIAITYFYNQFTSAYHWKFLRDFSMLQMDSCLDLAIKACGMAAFNNVHRDAMGKTYATAMYANALDLLNQRLSDAKCCRSDESLIAVILLGYYEHFACDGRESIQSWKAHIKGATQLLKLRGKAQMRTRTGRSLFRELRVSILVASLWNDVVPPAFLWDLQAEVEACSTADDVSGPGDALARLILDYSILRANMRTREVSDAVAMVQASELERRFMEWSINTSESDERWRYYEIDVPDSGHVWNGKVHAYTCHPAPNAWNTWRCVRIMLTRSQELLCRRSGLSETEREQQLLHLRQVWRQMADDICATVPVQLGHAAPAYNSTSVMITAHGSIWPVFFAATCAFERMILPMGQTEQADHQPSQGSFASAQGMWLLGRLDYISQAVGVRLAEGVAATLKSDFRIYTSIFKE